MIHNLHHYIEYIGMHQLNHNQSSIVNIVLDLSIRSKMLGMLYIHQLHLYTLRRMFYKLLVKCKYYNLWGMIDSYQLLLIDILDSIQYKLRYLHHMFHNLRCLQRME